MKLRVLQFYNIKKKVLQRKKDYALFGDIFINLGVTIHTSGLGVVTIMFFPLLKLRFNGTLKVKSYKLYFNFEEAVLGYIILMVSMLK